ncbi:MAG TPA: enoyl-CoA hydratase [Gammaproteobacteria bacterium]|nr:enoyl-CoA hydratase [Gammaproteobacteria bacterium]
MAQSDPESVTIDTRTLAAGEAAWLTIDRRKRLNALDSALMDRVAEQLGSLAERPGLRAVVLTGAGGRAFIGGADIGELAGVRDPQEAEAFIRRVHDVCRCLRDLPVPVIARIDGYALGAGMEVAAACDIRIASTDAVFGMPEVKVGIPSVVEAALLPGLIGWGHTRELLLFGRNIDADTACHWGFVDRLVPPEELDTTIREYLEALSETGARAVMLQKRLIRKWETLPLDEAIEAGVRAFAMAWDDDEPTVMLNAFGNRKR